MSEDTSTTPTTNTDSGSHSSRRKKDEIFGFPRDDVTLGVAAAGLGLAGIIGGKIIYDMFANGQIQNPFQPQNTRVTYSDVYEQQKAQQEYEAEQQRMAQASAQQPQPQLETRTPEGGDPAAQTMPAYTPDYAGFDDGDDGVSYSTTVRKPNGNRFDRINGGG